MYTKQIPRIIVVLLLLAFILLSLFFMLPKTYSDISQTRAKTLKKQIIVDGNTEKVDYVDDAGNITFAADIGFATKIIETFDNCKLEHFYDDKGEPVSQYPGYYGMLKKYDEKERIIHLSYLGIDDYPVITAFGYSDKSIQYYDDGKIKEEKYYDTDGCPICTKNYGYGFFREYYENGRVIKTTYLNSEDRPMFVGMGYAIVVQKIYIKEGHEKGKVESEFYYDENGDPIYLALGQYGVHKEYDENGLESVLVYLDKEGNPTITNKGYTRVNKTYYANNYPETEMYFDIEGNPYSLADGQYGIKKKNDQITYLDINGKETINIKRLLYNHTWMIIPFSFIIILFSALTGKRWNLFFFCIYTGIIAYLTLLYRENVQTTSAELLGSYKKIIIDEYVRIDILRNIWLFVPLGAILSRLNTKKIILIIPVIMSIFIEGIQFFTNIGFCEVDDVISNSLGAIVGFSINIIITNIILRTKYKTNENKEIT